MQNIIYKTVIVGASTTGIMLYNKLKRAGIDTKVVSSDFTNTTTGNTVLKVDRISGTVCYSDAKRGLIILNLTSGETVCCENVILACGLNSKRLQLDTNCIFYKLSDFNIKSKTKPVTVVGNSAEAVTAAIKLAKKYSYVYVCSPTAKLHCGLELANTLYKTKNIVVLPLCHITSCRSDKTGKLTDITLSTFETLKCGGILAFTEKEATVHTCFNSGMLKFDSDRHIIINNTGETGLVPKLFAVGSCTTDSSTEVLDNIVMKIKENVVC